MSQQLEFVYLREHTKHQTYLFFECLRDVYKKNKLCHQSVPHVFFDHSYQQTKKHTNKTRQLRQLRSTPDCFAASECLFWGGAITPPKYTQWRHRRANSSFISRHWVMNMSACARRIKAWNKNWVEKLRLQKPASAGQSLKQAQRKRPTLPRTCDGKETVEKIRFVFWKTFAWYWKMDEQKLAGGGGGRVVCQVFVVWKNLLNVVPALAFSCPWFKTCFAARGPTLISCFDRHKTLQSIIRGVARLAKQKLYIYICMYMIFIW